MSTAIVTCRAQLGLQAPLVHVEVSLDPGLPSFSIVGLPATVVRESKDRVRAAIVNSNFEFPAGRITVNLSPADLPKRGGRFDLPIAMGILLASGQVKTGGITAHAVTTSGSTPERPPSPGTATGTSLELFGELGLTGELKPVPGLLVAASQAAQAGHEILIPQANTEEVAVLLGTGPEHNRALQVRAAGHLRQVCAHLNGVNRLQPIATPTPASRPPLRDADLDLIDVRGHVLAKRALALAASGGHSLLMRGPPGAGKSMLAMRLPGLLPPMTAAESLEVAAVASVSGLPVSSTFGCRPFRTPHHTATVAGLVGGGATVRPGEVSLAHHGVLFLDELLEYDRRTLEALREPLETGVISISRAAHHAHYPAQFQLVAAMNPCPCGRRGDPAGDCRCTPIQVAQYLGRLSGPLLERFDIHLQVHRVDPSAFDATSLPEQTSAEVARQVARTREIQQSRQGVCNARMTDAQIQRYCQPDARGRQLLDRSIRVFGLSARSRQRILKLARTSADFEGDAHLGELHVGEAIGLRRLDRTAADGEDGLSTAW